MIRYREHFLEILLSSDRENSLKFIDDNIDSIENIENFIMEVQDTVGSLWEKGSVSLAQIYMAGSITEEIISRIWGNSVQDDDTSKIGFAVLSDYHSLGMKIVSAYLNSRKMRQNVLGIGLEPEQVISELRSSNIEILLISTLMLPAAYNVKILKEKMNEQKLAHIPIVVGGAPFRLDSELWKIVGADAYAVNAETTYQLVNNFLKKGAL